MGTVELFIPGTFGPVKTIYNVRSITVMDGYIQIHVTEKIDDTKQATHTINSTLDYVYYEDGYGV